LVPVGASMDARCGSSGYAAGGVQISLAHGETREGRTVGMRVIGTPIRVLIADGETLLRTGLGRVLDQAPGMEVVAEAADGVTALQMAATESPSIAVIDVKLPALGGIETARRMAEAHPGTKVLMLTNGHSDSSVISALRAGASGYMLKSSSAEAVASGIRAVMAGEYVLSAPVADRLTMLLTGNRAYRELYDGLTPRELEVLTMIAGGSAYVQIAGRMKIGHKTVRNYVSHIYEKLALYSRAQITMYAVRKGLVEVSTSDL
jgi:DNA-binding NarL/FixJ family response regulator